MPTDTEDYWISLLRSRWPRNEPAGPDTIALADQAVVALPKSCRLWVARGDLIRLGSEACRHELAEALRSYERAAELDPQFAEAWEEIGHYYDAVLDDEVTAQFYFERARQIEGSKSR